MATLGEHVPCCLICGTNGHVPDGRRSSATVATRWTGRKRDWRARLLRSRESGNQVVVLRGRQRRVGIDLRANSGEPSCGVLQVAEHVIDRGDQVVSG